MIYIISLSLGRRCRNYFQYGKESTKERNTYKPLQISILMGLFQGRPKRKPSGGRYWPFRKKKAREMGRLSQKTVVGKKNISKKIRIRGGHIKTSLLQASTANVMIDGKAKKVKIETVVENPANRHYVRQKVITKGAIIKTTEGFARVTSRPTKDGVVNAVLMKKK